MSKLLEHSLSRFKTHPEFDEVEQIFNHYNNHQYQSDTEQHHSPLAQALRFHQKSTLSSIINRLPSIRLQSNPDSNADNEIDEEQIQIEIDNTNTIPSSVMSIISPSAQSALQSLQS